MKTTWMHCYYVVTPTITLLIMMWPPGNLEKHMHVLIHTQMLPRLYSNNPFLFRHYQKGLRLDPEHSELKKAYFGLKNLLKKTKSVSVILLINQFGVYSVVVVKSYGVDAG